MLDPHTAIEHSAVVHIILLYTSCVGVTLLNIDFVNNVFYYSSHRNEMQNPNRCVFILRNAMTPASSSSLTYLLEYLKGGLRFVRIRMTFRHVYNMT